MLHTHRARYISQTESAQIVPGSTVSQQPNAGTKGVHAAHVPKGNMRNNTEFVLLGSIPKHH